MVKRYEILFSNGIKTKAEFDNLDEALERFNKDEYHFAWDKYMKRWINLDHVVHMREIERDE
ncbi:hypothetical protein ACF3NG_06885 [Aerococcaceae bacterium WGS1372]